MSYTFRQYWSYVFTFPLLLSAIVLTPVVAVGNDVVHVQTGSSIQAAITQSAPGKTIELAAGEWHENLTIGRSITLRGQGAGATAIIGDTAGYPVLRIAATQTASVTVTGMTITGAHGECADAGDKTCADGIIVQGNASLTINDCTITGNSQYGVHVAEDARITVEQATISGNYAGIWLSSSTLGKITDTDLTGNGFGIVAFEHAQVLVMESTISASSRDGILVADSASITLTRTNILGSKRTGISIDVPPCYNTTRTFTGLIVGVDDSIPDTSEDRGNAVSICPPDLSVIGTPAGGFFPSNAIDALLSHLPVPPPMEGAPDAPVTILEFTDFACPYCNRFTSETLPLIERDYIDSGKAKLYFLPFPVHGIASNRAAEAGFCAQEQGRFWAFQRLLFAQYRIRGQSALTPAGLAAIAAAAGEDRDRFLHCLTANGYQQAVEAAVLLGEKLGVDGTPTFFINGNRVAGAAPYDTFQQAIEAELVRGK